MNGHKQKKLITPYNYYEYLRDISDSYFIYYLKNNSFLKDKFKTVIFMQIFALHYVNTPHFSFHELTHN